MDDILKDMFQNDGMFSWSNHGDERDFLVPKCNVANAVGCCVWRIGEGLVSIPTSSTVGGYQ
jgi:hypothetical protein